jgi:hypothetical protein
VYTTEKGKGLIRRGHLKQPPNRCTNVHYHVDGGGWLEKKDDMSYKEKDVKFVTNSA